MGCKKCKEKTDTIGCVQKDDVPEILEKISASTTMSCTKNFLK